MDKERLVEGLDKDGKTVSAILKNPGMQEYRDSQIEYNKAFRLALDSGALLRQKLTDHMKEQDIWSDEKQKENDKFIEDISAKERILQSGGIKLSEAKEVALELRVLRSEFRDFLAEKNSMDQNSVEGQADNARFSELVRLCMVNPKTKKPFFENQEDYDNNADQPWVVEASAQLAEIIYGLDPNYDNKLTENKFLKEFDFVDDELSLIDKNGHTVDSDGRLVDKDGRFVAYRSQKSQLDQNAEDRYYVNRDGVEVVEIVDSEGDSTWVTKANAQRKPFLDDNGKEILTAKKEDAEKEEDLVADKPKKTRKKVSAEPNKTSTD
jgi:hypothetical protein